MSDNVFDINSYLRPVSPRPAELLTVEQRYAVAELIGYAEGVISSGVLTERGELQLRLSVNRACTAFGLPTKGERVPS